MDNIYWNKYYKKTDLTEISRESSFAKMCKESIFPAITDKRLIELGTGNGRDLVYFSQDKMCDCIG